MIQRATSPARARARRVLAAVAAVAMACVAGTVISARATAGVQRPGNLPFFYDLYTFRGDGGTTDVVAAFAVPVEELEAEDAGGGVRYRFDVSLVLADTALGTVTRTDDSVFVPVSRPLEGEHLLFTHVKVPARPSRTTVHRAIVTDAATYGIGQLYDSMFPIPDYRGDTLMLSDIALGQPGAAAGWERGEVTLALFPTSQFPSSSFDVYYEVYNLPYRHAYTTRIAVEPLERGSGIEPVALRFSGEAATRRGGTLPELRRVEASLPKGGYRLTVTVTDDDTGESASRSRDFHVRGWAPGATLVAALPWGRSSD